jgi:hypothetical protein
VTGVYPIQRRQELVLEALVVTVPELVQARTVAVVLVVEVEAVPGSEVAQTLAQVGAEEWATVFVVVEAVTQEQPDLVETLAGSQVLKAGTESE